MSWLIKPKKRMNGIGGWLLWLIALVSSAATADVIAVRAGTVIDPEAGTSLAKQPLLIEDGKFKEVGSNVTIPRGAISK